MSLKRKLADTTAPAAKLANIAEEEVVVSKLPDLNKAWDFEFELPAHHNWEERTEKAKFLESPLFAEVKELLARAAVKYNVRELGHEDKAFTFADTVAMKEELRVQLKAKVTGAGPLTERFVASMLQTFLTHALFSPGVSHEIDAVEKKVAQLQTQQMELDRQIAKLQLKKAEAMEQRHKLTSLYQMEASYTMLSTRIACVAGLKL